MVRMFSFSLSMIFLALFPNLSFAQNSRTYSRSLDRFVFQNRLEYCLRLPLNHSYKLSEECSRFYRIYRSYLNGLKNPKVRQEEQLYLIQNGVPPQFLN